MTRSEKPGAVATVLAAAAVALLALLATGPADAASRYKVVKKTFSNSQPITIPEFHAEATPYPSEKNAGGFKEGKILDVNLRLKNFSHTYPDDVDVMLSHRGVNRTVMSDAGEGYDLDGISLTLDDEAPSSLPASGALTGGTFKPTNFEDLPGRNDLFFAPAPAPSGLAKLSGFDGKNPKGTWKLWVRDDVSDDSGGYGQFEDGWSITIKAKVLR